MIRTYITKKIGNSNPMLIEAEKANWVSNHVFPWMSFHYSRIDDLCVVFVQGDADDHAMMKSNSLLFFDVGNLDTDLDKLVKANDINTIVNASDIDITASDLDGIVSNRDFVNALLRKGSPNHPLVDFHKKPNPAGTFTDAFTDSNGTLLEARAGWTKVVNGLYKADILDNALTFRTDSGSGPTTWECTDQGSADQYVSAVDLYFATKPTTNLAVRLVDGENFIGYRIAGTGAAGARCSNYVADSPTDLQTTQGGAGYSFKIECDGENISFYRDTAGGTSWTLVGTSNSIADHKTETAAGFRNEEVTGASEKYDNFENGPMAAGGLSIPIAMHHYKQLMENE